MLVMEVRECNRANICQLGDATGQGGQHRGDGSSCTQQVSVLALKKPLLARTVNWPKKAPLMMCLPRHLQEATHSSVLSTTAALQGDQSPLVPPAITSDRLPWHSNQP